MSENRSDSIGELAAALSLAQGEIVGAIKDSTNPFFKSTYADLASVWDAVRGPLTRNGLAVIQTTEIGEQVELVTTLAHKSGEWVRGVCPIFAKALDPQSVGSAITYARRYGLASIVGVAQIDDDGNAAQAGHSAVAGSKAPTKTDEVKNPDPTYAPSIRAALKLTADCDKQIKEVADQKGLKYSEALIKGWAAGQRNFDELMAWLANFGMEVIHVEDEPIPLYGPETLTVYNEMKAKDRLLFKSACDKAKCDHLDVLAQFLESGAEYSHDALMAFVTAEEGALP